MTAAAPYFCAAAPNDCTHVSTRVVGDGVPDVPRPQVTSPPANHAAQPTALSPPVSGREANSRSAMHKNAAGLVPTCQQPQRILQRINAAIRIKAAFLWGSTPFLWPRSKKWGGTGMQPPRWLQTARQGRAGTPSPTSSFSHGRGYPTRGTSRRRPLQSTRQRGCDITHVPASSAAQPTALVQPVSGREANPRSAMHKDACKFSS